MEDLGSSNVWSAVWVPHLRKFGDRLNASVAVFIGGVAAGAEILGEHIVARDTVIGLIALVLCYAVVLLVRAALAARSFEQAARRFEEADRTRQRFARFIQGTANDPRYLEWERQVLSRAYPEHVFRVGFHSYVAAIVPVAPDALYGGVRREFDSSSYAELTEIESPRRAEVTYTDDGRAYLEFACSGGEKARVRNPERLGFDALAWDFSGAAPLVRVGVITFADSVATEAPLRLELFDQFERGVPPHAVDLSHRHSVWNGKGLPVASPAFRPLLSVQALVVMVEDGHQPQFVLMERSNDVAVRQGWYQFPPSGAMEVFNDKPETDHAELRKQSRAGASLQREFVEELFGCDEYQAAQDETFENLETNLHGRLLKSDFEEGRVSIRFMGVVADAVGLRGELSFLIVARNVSWKLKRGQEAKGALVLKTFEETMELFERPEAKINPTSAALFRLAIDSGALAEEGLIPSADGSRGR